MSSKYIAHLPFWSRFGKSIRAWLNPTELPLIYKKSTSSLNSFLRYWAFIELFLDDTIMSTHEKKNQKKGTQGHLREWPTELINQTDQPKIWETKRQKWFYRTLYHVFWKAGQAQPCQTKPSWIVTQKINFMSRFIFEILNTVEYQIWIKWTFLQKLD